MPKIIAKLFVIAQVFVLAFFLVSSAKLLLPEARVELPEVEVRVLTLYDVCVEGTLVPADLLRAVAIVESGERDDAVGDGGKSFGRFQLYEVYHQQRAEAWGEYLPTDPIQAGRIAALYLQDCIIAYSGDIERGICSYRQGVQGVADDGATIWYYERVMNARARI
jgi:hypothetical protein